MSRQTSRTRGWAAPGSRPRGFSMIELVVAVAVSTIVLAAGVALLLGTQRLFEHGVDERAVQETARVALDEVGTSLRVAGYGLEPTFAFDFGQAATVMDRVPPGSQVRFGGYACAGNVQCRDRVDGPDELVFYSRDPSFGLDLAATENGPGGLKLVNPNAPGKPLQLRAGQVLQVMCYGTGNQWLWAYVTVATDVTSTAGEVKVDLVAPTAATLDFPRQNALLNQPCFAGGLRRAFKIDRYRYFIAAVEPDGDVQPWGTAGTRPYLMLDQGTGPAVAIAPDVEDLQVSYVFPLAAAAAQVVGATPGTRLADAEAGIDLAPAQGVPAWQLPTLHPSRATHHPGNIRAVRVAMVVRSQRADPAVFDDTVPAAGNRPAVAGEVGFRRMVFESTLRAHNMETRLPLFPVYARDSGFAGSNVGGG